MSLRHSHKIRIAKNTQVKTITSGAYSFGTQDLPLFVHVHTIQLATGSLLSAEVNYVCDLRTVHVLIHSQM